MINFYPSNRRNKKYHAIVRLKNGEILNVHFGDKRYQHYKDTTPLKLYSQLDHLDKARRVNYKKRHKKIKNKDNKPSYKVKYSPAWFSWNYLW